MKITKNDLINLGIDPSIYDSSDMKMIETNADVIIDGKLPTLLVQISAPSPLEAQYKADAEETRRDIVELLKKIEACLDGIYEICSSKQSIFASSLTSDEVARILEDSLAKLNVIFVAREDILDLIMRIVRTVDGLSEIQALYSQRLYNAGMLNAAFAAVYPDKPRDEIRSVSAVLFERLNGITSFINDLTDRGVIFQEATEFKLACHLDTIVTQLDFDNDGASINVSNTMSAILSAKQLIRNVIER